MGEYGYNMAAVLAVDVRDEWVQLTESAHH